MRTAIADAELRDPSPACLVVNTEASWRYPLAEWILERRWDCIVLDEPHLGGIKTNGTRASEFVAQLTARSRRRLALTGTPLAHNPLDAWGQYRFLDPTIFGPDYAAFLDRYAAPKQLRRRKKLRIAHSSVAAVIAELWGADSPLIDEWGEAPDYTPWLPGLRNAEEFAARIAPITWSCKSADVLDLPPLLQDSREVKIGAEAQRLYDQLLDQLWADTGHGTVTINSALTMSVRLQQITSGHVGTDNGRLYRFRDNPKHEALHDLLSQTSEPSVVFCRYIADLDVVAEITKSLGKRYAEFSHRRKDALTNLATLRQGVDVAGVQPKSGGVGIDLSTAKIGVWYSLALSLPEYDQGIGRLHRPGSTGTRIYSIVAQGTIDADIHQAIADRREIIQAIEARIKRNCNAP
jgi:SNF2 family DNA or RNA helicase